MADFTAQVMPFVLRSLNAASVAELEQWSEDELYGYADYQLDAITGDHALVVEAYDGSDVAEGATDYAAVVAGQANYLYPDTPVTVIALALDGAPLYPTSVPELEALSDDWENDACGEGEKPTRFLLDYLGMSLMRLYPTPSANGRLTIVYIRHNPGVSQAQPIIRIPAPAADQLGFRAIGEARKKEGDAKMPEAAAFCDQILKLYEQVFEDYWGGAL